MKYDAAMQRVNVAGAVAVCTVEMVWRCGLSTATPYSPSRRTSRTVQYLQPAYSTTIWAAHLSLQPHRMTRHSQSSDSATERVCTKTNPRLGAHALVPAAGSVNEDL